MKKVLFAAVGLSVLLAPSFVSSSTQNTPQTQVQLQGLRAPVTVRRDERGIPYIEATNDDDLYFAQGYITASDRLWQMDLQRRTARGQLSEHVVHFRFQPRHAAVAAAALVGEGPVLYSQNLRRAAAGGEQILHVRRARGHADWN